MKSNQPVALIECAGPVRFRRLRSPLPANPLAILERLPEWWAGKVRARKALLDQATSDKERDQHLNAISEYERRIKAAGEIA